LTTHTAHNTTPQPATNGTTGIPHTHALMRMHTLRGTPATDVAEPHQAFQPHPGITRTPAISSPAIDALPVASAKATGHTRGAVISNKTLASTMQFTSNKQPTSPTRHQSHPSPPLRRRSRAGMTETGPARETPPPHLSTHRPTATRLRTRHRGTRNGPFPQDPTVCPNHPAPPARFPLPPHAPGARRAVLPAGRPDQASE